MLHDKAKWFGLSGMGGIGFAAWGVANLSVYGLSLVMDKENWDYHFVYKGNGKFLQPFKSMMASDSFVNVAWTAPSLIGGGMLLQAKCGSRATFKLFLASLVASYLTTTCMGPTTFNSHMNIRSYMPMRWDCIDTKRGTMVGADLMAGTCLYSLCFAYGLWHVGLAFACFDVCYYGPMGISMPVTAAVAAATML